jgi:hypothetical protein
MAREKIEATTHGASTLFRRKLLFSEMLVEGKMCTYPFYFAAAIHNETMVYYYHILLLPLPLAAWSEA